jgi:hypothetical protein
VADRYRLSPVEKALVVLERDYPPPPRKKVITCPSPDHEDKRPSATLYPDGGFKCHSCGAWGSALDLYCLREGLTVTQALTRLGCFDADYVRKPKPRAPRVFLAGGCDSSEFALRWELAKQLACQPHPQADILAGWDTLEQQGVDIPEVWRLVCLIKGVALFRHANPAKAHLERERNRAVRKLLAEVG